MSATRRPRPIRVMVLVMMLAGASALSAEQEASPAPAQRPAYQVLRQNEVWPETGSFADRDLFDSIKHMTLSEDGAVWLSLGGQVRERFEHFENSGFRRSGDDNFWLTRFRFHGDLHWGEHLRVFAEGKSAFEVGRDLPGGARTLDEDTADLQQLFADLILPVGADATLTVRPGRQMFLFGKQRLASPLDWSNTMRAWDGVSIMFQTESCTVTGFWSYHVPVDKYEFNTSDANSDFYGVYATGKLPHQANLDLYFLGLSQDDTLTVNGTTGTQDRYTLGGRLSGRVGQTGFDYDVEGAYQFGHVGQGEVDAFMVSSELGYTIAGCPASPRLFAGFDYASGDRSPGGDVQTFHQLYPLGHAYLGYLDAVGRQNNIAATLGVKATPLDRLSVQLKGHLFWRASSGDSLYNAGGTPSVAPVNGETPVGAEIDLLFEYQLDRHTSAGVGYSRFFRDSFIEQAVAGGGDTDFVYVAVQYTF